MVVLSPMITSCRTTPLLPYSARFSRGVSFVKFGNQGRTIINANPSVSFPLLNLRCSASAGGGGDIAGGGGGRGGGGGGGDENINDDDTNKGSFLQWYLSLLEKHPILTKSITSAILTLIGDITCQIFIDQVPSLDLKRTFVFTILGLVLVGPTLHIWYMYLNRLVSVTGASGALIRLLVDQCVFSPIFIGVFMTSLMILEGRSSQVVPKLKQEWVSSLIANWQLWIPFQFLNFRFVPPQFQVLFANVVALVWNVILSYKAHKVIKS
ncbi:protein SYM1 [Impatiens glandulifera]|uniref:protein SYM1 n=1 Tax=Impatiens glandulifera TaxID=253017 RepID=UPI001FB05771|nr:protein SYM1 [Impatiens glandulifera]